MYPRRMMIAGAILVLAAIAIFVFGLFFIGEKEKSLNNAAGFYGGVEGARQGDLVIVEGKVSAKNKILVHDFVDGAKQYNDEGSWMIREAYRQPVIADLARGEVILNSEYMCSDAEGNNVLETDDWTPNKEPMRYQGLRRGDPITAVGTLTSLAPAALEVGNWYSGTIAQYRDSITSNRRSAYIFCPLIFLAGAGLFFLGYKKR